MRWEQLVDDVLKTNNNPHVAKNVQAYFSADIAFLKK